GSREWSVRLRAQGHRPPRAPGLSRGGAARRVGGGPLAPAGRARRRRGRAEAGEPRRARQPAELGRAGNAAPGCSGPDESGDRGPAALERRDREEVSPASPREARRLRSHASGGRGHPAGAPRLTGPAALWRGGPRPAAPATNPATANATLSAEAATTPLTARSMSAASGGAPAPSRWTPGFSRITPSAPAIALIGHPEWGLWVRRRSRRSAASAPPELSPARAAPATRLSPAMRAGIRFTRSSSRAALLPKYSSCSRRNPSIESAVLITR